MALPYDDDPKFAGYAHPERLVSTRWLADHLGADGLVVVESDEDVLLYETGHIPGAVKIDWHADLKDQLARDYIDGEAFAGSVAPRASPGTPPWSSTATSRTGGPPTPCGSSRSSATRTCACSTAAGPSGWPRAGEMTTEVPSPAPTDYPVVERDDAQIRAFQDEVLGLPRRPAASTCAARRSSPASAPTWPTTRRRARCAAATSPAPRSVPWARAVNEDGTFKSREELEAIYEGEKGLDPADDVIAYCRIGERSSLTWFVLHVPARLPRRAQLRRLVDRVGQRRARPDRHRRRRRSPPDDRDAPRCPPPSRGSSRTSPPSPPTTGCSCCWSSAEELPALPERYADHPELLEPVPECQSPIFLLTEVEGAGDDATVHLYFSAPPESPTTRGFAGILHEGLDGLSARAVLDVPADVYNRLGLAEVVSPLRLRGMAGMLGRIKRQVREKAGL